jgi:hypothetical protein
MNFMQRSHAAALVAALAVIVAACGGRTALDDGSYTNTDAATDAQHDAGPPKQTKSNKMDLLFAIDNSASMGDKQAILAREIPLVLSRLTSPWCVPQSDPTGVAVPPTNGQCPSGDEFEFPALQDLHIGIVSSSLGSGGLTSPGDPCVVGGTDPTHQDDKGHLLNRTLGATGEGSVAAAKPLDGNGGNFLAWVPASSHPNVTPEPSVDQLTIDFATLIQGVQQHGCGLEAQLESWYRFLVQPDPYDSIVLSNGSPPKASLQGVDATLLKMRHDFLRPDSIVVIVQITDEEDSWSDPMWLDGFGWTVRTNNFPGGPGGGAGPRGTSECDKPVDPNNPTTTGPNDPDCVSCAFAGENKPSSGQPIGDDPNCRTCAGGMPTCPQLGWYTPASPNVNIGANDGLNVRYTDSMRARYGLDPQWNVQRYVDGLSSRMVPDRDHEVHDSTEYATTQKNCENPLFAASLPDGSDVTPAALCDLPDGPRDPSLVYYLMIGGVPWQLLAENPQNTSLPLKRTLSSSDWQRIVGKDPAHFQLDGIDPHMIESIAPRVGLEMPTAVYDLGSDPESGREWNTLTSPAAIDLQFACVFDLDIPKDCTSAENQGACDCMGSATSAADGPPLCDPANRTTQIRGKAYPTIRELRVAEGLGNQGVVASICPRKVLPNELSYFDVLFARIRDSISQ